MYAGERFNALTHAVGSLLALIGSGALVAVAARSGDPWKMVMFRSTA
jgi:hemolysin III